LSADEDNNVKENENIKIKKLNNYISVIKKSILIASFQII